ncbi:hypothetical protein AMS68_005385 [Peltaster fructicola]|uniref:Uncharacterized protein n=1 Tax=Peltaster fructicola TaxID=286661 RepID=A0A6H0XZ44_9PEZI|nr:hypothetical protein AMS68_005385 [Peltaster fructicola]
MLHALLTAVTTNAQPLTPSICVCDYKCLVLAALHQGILRIIQQYCSSLSFTFPLTRCPDDSTYTPNALLEHT